MRGLLVFATALAAGALAYFAFLAVYMRVVYRRGMTTVERAQAEREEFLAAEAKGGAAPIERLGALLRQRGYAGDPVPVVAAGTVVYLALATVCRMLGATPLIGVLIAAPLSAGTATTLLRVLETRRRRRFNEQLITALFALASHLETGAGVQRAFDLTIPSLEEPLRTELANALAAGAATDLGEALDELRERWPSRALDVTTASYRLHLETGGALAPVFRSAAELLRADFAISQEASAEISQTRGEFFLVIGIIGAICVGLVAGSDDSIRSALVSPVGLVTVGAFGAWAAFGVKRAMNLFNTIKGGL